MGLDNDMYGLCFVLHVKLATLLLVRYNNDSALKRAQQTLISRQYMNPEDLLQGLQRNMNCAQWILEPH
jgi:hypothetical protein